MRLIDDFIILHLFFLCSIYTFGPDMAETLSYADNVQIRQYT